jgi:hypothetical protein
VRCRARERLSVAAAAAGAAAAAYVLVVRPWHLRWGASADEARQPLPGDELVPRPRMETTRAVTIAAPAGRVWAWLVQLGTGRAGWYSYDALENLMGLRVRSASGIVPEFQQLAVGDVIPAAPAPYVGFRVRRVEPPRTLVTSAALDLSTGRRLDPGGPHAGRRLDGSWAFVLQRRDESRCRLLARLRADYAPGPLNDLAVRAVLEPLHFLMERRMLQGIKRRAEAASERAESDR